eukprot:SAG25_NODE_9097_length_388_cov_0.688581_1_plen_96_part_10
MYDDATVVAEDVKARMAAASGGSDPIAAAMAILNPEIVGKLEALFGDVVPVMQQFLTSVTNALNGWLKKQKAKIDKAMVIVKKRLATIEKQAAAAA